MTDPWLCASGLNNHFTSARLPFNEYIAHMQRMISSARPDLTPENQATILAANCPFEWQPRNRPKRGILLVHGLLDSPLYMQDIAYHFLAKGFLVRAITLPGHGTVPGDLLNTHHKAWREAVNYGINGLKECVEEVFVAGFSLGGALTLLEAQDTNGILLFNPALKPTGNLYILAKAHRFISRFIPGGDWFRQLPQKNYAKYQSIAYTGFTETVRIMALAKREAKSVNTPLFLALSGDDESVSANYTLDWFKRQTHPSNRCLFYTSETSPPSGEKITSKTCAYPDQRILDFSHTCITVSPNNHYLGQRGEFQDFQHYPNAQPPKHTEVFQGSILARNLTKHVIQRLTYNPDFHGMMAEVDKFLN